MNELIRSDGYVNATMLCKQGGKEFKNWKRYDHAKIYINECFAILNIPEDKLIETIITGANGNRGSWIHPYIALNVAQWISAKFAVKVAIWIDEWKKINNNETIYKNELQDIKPDKRNEQYEKIIQDRMVKDLNGIKEVECPIGFIDVLTDNEIIEIKTFDKWKHAIGQIICYNQYFNKNMRIHLFHINDVDSDYVENISVICKKLHIKLSIEKVE